MAPYQPSLLAPFLAACLCLGLADPASSIAPKIGIAAPLSGPYAPLGRQLHAGAAAAALAAGMASVTADDRCTGDGGAEAARQLQSQGATLVVGFLCSEAIEAALPLLAEADIIVITPGVRGTGLTDQRRRTGWLVYRTAPRADLERSAIGEILTRQWAGLPFALLDDGSLYGRELSESLRLSAEEAGLQPALVEAYRPDLDNQAPLVARLQRLGVTHAFIGGEGEDVARFARDVEAIGHDLVLAGGEALRATPGLPEGTMMIGLQEPAEPAAIRFHAAMDAAAAQSWQDVAAPPELIAGLYALPAFAAVEIAAEALQIGSDETKRLQEILDTTRFATVAGTVEFDEKGDVRGNPYRLFRHDGIKFRQVRP